MPRQTRMFDIIQLLRAATEPWTAQKIADELEVTKRTIYRDIASLQAARVPIEGEAGIGYIMRPGFDLPPVNFDVEEAEAVTVGLSLIARTGDTGLKRAATRAIRKLSEAVPENDTLLSSSWGPNEPQAVDMSLVRQAIRQERKLFIRYEDGDGHKTERGILPIALIYHTEAVVLAAWCELRQDFRHFRPDRILACSMLEETFKGESARLRSKWNAAHEGDLRAQNVFGAEG